MVTTISPVKNIKDISVKYLGTGRLPNLKLKNDSRNSEKFVRFDFQFLLIVY